MRVVITGGGTGGHTSAGLAVAAALRDRGCHDLHWIGSGSGIEARRVPEAGLPFHAIATGKLRRYWDWQNVPDLLLRTPAGIAQAWSALRRLQPSLVFATGGFVSLPASVAAWITGIPLVIHEQTSVPGLANRIAGRFARHVALTFPPDGAFPGHRVTVTGNPLRPELAGGSRADACRHFGLEPGPAIVYVTGGSLGSHRINRTVGTVLDELLEHCQVIHQCGDNRETGDLAWLAERREALAPSQRARYALTAYVGSEPRDVYAAAALIVGRSGAGTVNECCQLGRPAVYIPLPGTSGDEQTRNARLVEAVGGAIVLPQQTLTAATLLGAVRELLSDAARLRAMADRARRLAVPDAAERIARLLFTVAAASLEPARSPEIR